MNNKKDGEESLKRAARRFSRLQRIAVEGPIEVTLLYRLDRIYKEVGDIRQIVIINICTGIEVTFNPGELKDLAFDLAMPDHLLSSVVHSENVRAIINYAHRSGRLHQLVTEVRNRRPNITN